MIDFSLRVREAVYLLGSTATTNAEESEGTMAGNAKRNKWGVSLRVNTITDVIFPDGLPPGAVASIETVPGPKGRSIDLTLPGRAKMRHRKRARK